jgi:class 3 adenylate cyclase/pimeloyl-ACP methyl ester carboxylesterase
MEPRIQYATTSDAVSIAFWSIGEGIPLVEPPPALPWSHIELEWQIPEWRHWYEHMAESFRIVRYDNRGSGLSSGEITGDVAEHHIRDLEAVVDRLGLEKFALFGLYGNAPIVIEYAIRHPERVSHLILWCAAVAPGTAEREHSDGEMFDRLRGENYELFTEMLAHTLFGWSEGAAAHRFAGYMRAALSAEAASRCWEFMQKVDVSHLLPQITQPTLVLHRRDLPQLGIDSARKLAASIPDARLKVLEGSSLSPYIGDMTVAMDAMTEKAGEERVTRSSRSNPHPNDAPTGGFRVIMFTDMEGSTAMTQRIGDAPAQELVRLHNIIVSEALETHGGTRVKHTGDGIMASFPTASGAVDCAIAVQRAFAEHNEKSPTEQVMVRIGINAGEPVIEGDDLFGTAVQLASRVCARAQPGDVLTTDVVRQLVAGKGFLFSDHGEEELRGFEDPVRLYEVRWRETGV